jgi:hypothetical protein
MASHIRQPILMPMGISPCGSRQLLKISVGLLYVSVGLLYKLVYNSKPLLLIFDVINAPLAQGIVHSRSSEATRS